MATHNLDLRAVRQLPIHPCDEVTVTTDNGVFGFTGAQVIAAAKLLRYNDGHKLGAVRDVRALSGQGLAQAVALVKAAASA